jgi:hypothetical protein
MNAKTIRYQQAVEGYITSITRDILADKGFYPVALEDQDGPYMRFLDLPTPQLCGTETQKYTYARLKAQEIVEDMKRWNPHLDYATFG